MNLCLLVDPEAVPPEDPQLEGREEPILTEVEFHIASTLRQAGHRVDVLSCGPNLLETATRLRERRPQLVFNLTEHYAGDRGMDLHLAAMLDLLDVPYTGSGPAGLLLCRDKAICKQILGHHRIKIPNFVTLPPGRVSTRRRLRYPVIVKPVMEDGSDGITRDSLVQHPSELKDRVLRVHERMNEPAICEEFIEGREVYIGVLGNHRLEVLPPREIHFGEVEGGPVIATARVKQNEAYRRKWNITYRHAELPEEQLRRINTLSKRIYRLLRLRDYGRIDFRITPDGVVYFLEANPNPDLTYGDEVGEAAGRAGLTYDQLILKIVRLALRRVKSDG